MFLFVGTDSANNFYCAIIDYSSSFLHFLPVSTNPAPSAVTAALNEYHNNPLSPVATDSSVLDCSVLDSSVLVSSVVPWLFPFESSVPGVGLSVGSGVGVG